jgi:Uma2 family endonuclease
MSAKDSIKQTKTVKEQTESYGNFDRYEIIDHIRYDLKPSPTVNHQKLVFHLAQALYHTCHPNGVILVAPIDVYLDEGNIFQPDLIFISNENEQIIKEARIEGTPDLVAEILSPSTSINDKIRKKAQYERFGIKEYWLVDPIYLTVDKFVLKNEKFELYATFADGDTMTSEQFSCISVNLSRLFEKIR